MGTEKRMRVVLALTPDPDLVPVVAGLTGGLADQMGFEESQRLTLLEGVEQACRCLMGKGRANDGARMRVAFCAFPDRLEIIVEDGGDAAEPSEADSYLLNQLLDRVAVEETNEGTVRLILIKSLSALRS